MCAPGDPGGDKRPASLGYEEVGHGKCLVWGSELRASTFQLMSLLPAGTTSQKLFSSLISWFAHLQNEMPKHLFNCGHSKGLSC